MEGQSTRDKVNCSYTSHDDNRYVKVFATNLPAALFRVRQNGSMCAARDFVPFVPVVPSAFRNIQLPTII